jgi:hypothetical protein
MKMFLTLIFADRTSHLGLDISRRRYAPNEERIKHPEG